MENVGNIGILAYPKIERHDFLSKKLNIFKNLESKFSEWYKWDRIKWTDLHKICKCKVKVWSKYYKDVLINC